MQGGFQSVKPLNETTATNDTALTATPNSLTPFPQSPPPPTPTPKPKPKPHPKPPKHET